MFTYHKKYALLCDGSILGVSQCYNDLIPVLGIENQEIPIYVSDIFCSTVKILVLTRFWMPVLGCH